MDCFDYILGSFRIPLAAPCCGNSPFVARYPRKSLALIGVLIDQEL